jgi:hypothetical protein
MYLLQVVEGGSYRHSPESGHLSGLSRIHLPNRYTNGHPAAHVLICRVLSHQGLSRMLLLLQMLEPLLLQLLL